MTGIDILLFTGKYYYGNDDNNDYGEFSTTEVETDKNGVVTVVYTAPNSLPGNTERNITITEDSKKLTKTLNIQFQDPTSVGDAKWYDINVSSTDALMVDKNGTVTVTIHERDSSTTIDNDRVIDVNVTSLFNNILTKSDCLLSLFT